MNKAGLDSLEICDIVVTNSQGTTDLPIKDQVVSLSIFEDIFAPLVTCEISILDAMAISQDLPFIGEEKLKVSLKTTGDSEVSRYEFLLYGIDDTIPDVQNKYQVYRMRGISVESLTNAAISVQKGYKDTYDNVVKDLVSGFLKSKKKVTFAPSKGIHHTVVPNQMPLKAIDMCRQLAVSNDYPYSPFLFFETSTGFHFIDIVSQFKNAKKEDINTITRKYVNNQTEDVNYEMTDAFKSIVSFETTSKHDSMVKVNTGTYYSNLNKFDLTTKSFNEVETKLMDIQDQFDLATDGKFNTDQFVNSMSNMGATNYLVFYDSSRPESHIDYIGQKESYSSLFFQNIVEAEFHGDTTLEAGKVLYLDIKKSTGLTGDEPEQQDERQSGYYMITQLAHHVFFSGEPSMRTACTLVKGANQSIEGKI